jgi:hypothetical protein
MMKRLPIDIVRQIMEYDGRIKYRNGVFINQIPKTDERYNIFRSIPIKNYFLGSSVSLFVCFHENCLISSSFIGSKYILYLDILHYVNAITVLFVSGDNTNTKHEFYMLL